MLKVVKTLTCLFLDPSDMYSCHNWPCHAHIFFSFGSAAQRVGYGLLIHEVFLDHIQLMQHSR